MFSNRISRATGRAAVLALVASATAAVPALATPPTEASPGSQAPGQSNQPSNHAPGQSNQPTNQPPGQSNQPTNQPPGQSNQPTNHAPGRSNQPTNHAPGRSHQPSNHAPGQPGRAAGHRAKRGRHSKPTTHGTPTRPTSVWTVTSTARTGASPVVDPSSCTSPALTQPFLAWHDRNQYTLAAGQSVGDFSGTGWVLGGGASIETASLADGRRGSVLNLPVGGYAISPPTCVRSDYPTARTMVKTKGTAHVGAGVFYAAKPTHSVRLSGVLNGAGSGFALSRPFQVHPGNLQGWQVVQFLFGAAGTTGDAQIYNFYVDPRMLR